MPILHTTVATLPDEVGAEINKAEWNASHSISLTKAEFNTACSNGDFLYVGDVTVPTIATTTNILIGDGAGNATTGAGNITSASANALTVGPNGATNPALKVNGSIASSTTGLEIVPNSGSAARINAISSVANCDLILSSLGTSSTATLNGGNFAALQVAGNNIFSGSGNSMQFNPTSGSRAFTGNTTFRFISVASTSLTASTDINSAFFDFGQIQQHATGALALQQDMRVRPSTHSFVAASTLTNAAGFAVDGAPIVGTNATITNTSTYYSAGQAVGAATNSYGLNITANTGATNNYAAILNGRTNLNGGLAQATRVVTAAGTVTTTSDDYAVIVNKIVGAATAVTLTNPVAAFKQNIVIKDGKGDAFTNNITITPSAGTIDNAATYVININLASVTLQFDGTNWWVL